MQLLHFANELKKIREWFMFIVRICFSTATPWKWFIDIRLETFYRQTEYYTIVFHTRFTSLPSLNVTLNIWFYYSIRHPKEDCYMYSLQSHKYNTVISDYNSLYKRKYLDMHQKSVWFLYIYVVSHVWCAQ